MIENGNLDHHNKFTSPSQEERNMQDNIEYNNEFLPLEIVDPDINDESVTKNKLRTTEEIDNQKGNTTNNLRRSQRICKPTWKERGLKSYSTYYDTLHEEDYLLQDQMSILLAFLAKIDDDTMHFHQAIQQEDAAEFETAIMKGIKDHR